MFLYICAAKVARRDDDFVGLQRDLIQFYFDGIYQCLFAHWFYDSCCSENGDASYDAEIRIEGLLRGLFTFFGGDDHIESAAGRESLVDIFAHALAYGFDRLGDHPAGTGVDRGVSDGLVESRLGDSADAFAAVDMDAGPGRSRDIGADEHAVRDVGVVAGILWHGRPGAFTIAAAACWIAEAVLFDADFDRDVFARHKRDRLRNLSGKEHPGSR